MNHDILKGALIGAGIVGVAIIAKYAYDNYKEEQSQGFHPDKIQPLVKEENEANDEMVDEEIEKEFDNPRHITLEEAAEICGTSDADVSEEDTPSEEDDEVEVQSNTSETSEEVEIDTKKLADVMMSACMTSSLDTQESSDDDFDNLPDYAEIEAEDDEIDNLPEFAEIEEDSENI